MRAQQRRWRAVVVTLALILATTAIPSAHAVIKEYKRKDFPLGQGLRTWGYLHDHCLTLAPACNVGGGADGVLRPEATAQSIAIWVLAALRLDLPTSTSKGFSNIDWEVGPRRPPPIPPDTPLAANPAEPPGEPADECDPDAPGGSEPGDKWRIDILTDRNRHIEVKDWAKQHMVQNQLACYVDRAAESGLTGIQAQSQLNALLFAVPFVDNTGQVWCTWAPASSPLTDGHVYFARMNETPADAAVRCGGAALAAAAVVDKMKEKVKEIVNRERPEVDVEGLLKDTMRPAVIPSYRRIPVLSTTTYLISAPQRPDTRRDLVFEFGDGTASVLNVPAGTGVLNFSLTKSFPAPGRYTQRAGLAIPSVVLGQPGAAAQFDDQPWIPLVFEATTDVDPVPQPESDPDGDPNITLTVGPADNLADGQEVQVSGAGFPANSTGGRLRICNTGDERVCTTAIGTFATDGTGSFSPVLVNVVKTFTAAGVSVDCGVVACRLAGNLDAPFASHHLTFSSLPPPRPVADFDGDGDTDVSVFRPATGAWLVKDQATVFLGLNGDIPVPCDYDGNGLSDRAVFRPSVGGWFIEDQSPIFFGLNGDIPVPADYDGDGTCETAVFRPSVGGWYSPDLPAVFFGLNGDIPVPADYDGDGAADIAVYRPSVGAWYRNGAATTFFGLTGDIPVPGSYDGNSSADIAVFRPSDGGWYRNGGPTTFHGLNGDIPVPGDYDGNGSAGVAVYRPSTGQWFIQGGTSPFFGAGGDIPLPLPAAIRLAFFP